MAESIVCIFCAQPAIANIYKVGPVCDKWMRNSDHYPQSKTYIEKEIEALEQRVFEGKT